MVRERAIASQLHLVDLALYMPETRIFAISDLHLGIEESLQREGVLLPRQQLGQIRTRLDTIFAKLNVSPARPLSRLLINGDLRHQFGPPSRQESREAVALLGWLAERADELILIQGNHDGKLEWLARRIPPVRIKKSHQESHCLFIHGDLIVAEIPCDVQWIVIGHEHPAISLRDPVTHRVETFKCFLIGSYRDKRLLVQPSFNLLVAGTDLTREEVLSPFLSQDRLKNFRVYPVADDGRIYDFGPLRNVTS
jgi:hypothetical protein